jgi:xylulokinase
MKNYVLAHDLGTTGDKATLYNREGSLAGSAFSPYDTRYDAPGWAEQNPEDWWQAVRQSTGKLLETTGAGKGEIACVVFSGQMMGCLPVDRRGRPLRQAIIWADQRAVEQEQQLRARISFEDLYRITGHRLSCSYSLCKMLWLRDHQPEIYRQAWKFLHAKDFIIARLTGAYVTDPSDASGMNLYDLENGCWSEPILQAAGVDPDQLPEIRRSIDVAGEVRPEAASETGLAAGTPVVVGGGDGACAAAGAGVIHEGSAYNYIGSSSWIALARRKPVYDPGYRTFTFGHIVPGMVMPTGTMQAAGASYQWLRDQLCGAEVQAAEAGGENPYELMNALAAGSPAGANGLLFLPYLLGERSPRWNPQARGAFVGLTIRHTRADLIRSVLEGVTFNLRVILEAFRAQGAPIEAMRLIGGGARGRFWNRLMADIYGIPVLRLKLLEEATSLGAALAGGVGVGLYPDFSMIESMNPVAETLQPDPEAQAVYEKAFPLWDGAYTALEPVFEGLSRE